VRCVGVRDVFVLCVWQPFLLFVVVISLLTHQTRTLPTHSGLVWMFLYQDAFTDLQQRCVSVRMSEKICLCLLLSCVDVDDCYCSTRSMHSRVVLCGVCMYVYMCVCVCVCARATHVGSLRSQCVIGLKLSHLWRRISHD